MSDLSTVSLLDLKTAANSIQERAGNTTEFSRLFVDANLLNSLNREKNQVMYGRRGAGKTHLLGRLKEFYQESFEKNRILPIYIDARKLTEKVFVQETNPGISLLVTYRRFLDAIISNIEVFKNSTISLNYIEKVLHSGKKQEILNVVNDEIKNLKQIVRFGEIEMGLGSAKSEQKDEATNSKKTEWGIDAKMTSELKKLLDIDARVRAGLSKISSKRAEESMEVIFEGLTVINFAKISDSLNKIIQVLEIKSVVILLDEWSAIQLDHQPLLAEMIHTTLLSGERIFIKFACIPFLTFLSVTKSNGQSIGFPVGEEVFVGVDLDRVYNSYIDSEGVSLFLLKILQRHVGKTIEVLNDAQINEIFDFTCNNLFENREAFDELIHASAGIPRDFLIILSRAIKKTRELPISIVTIRQSLHEFFQEEKKHLISPNPQALELLEDIFTKLCLPANSYYFFISQPLANSRLVQELWHHRLIHQLHQGHFAYASETPGTYDIYAIDYGKFVMMSGSKKGQDDLDKIKKFSNNLREKIGIEPILEIETKPEVENKIREILSKNHTTKMEMKSPELEQILENCSNLVADPFLS